jgi:CheY-like chemotaxis protein/HPt (histidine-containing phosphotransfer) domain-containing protein
VQLNHAGARVEHITDINAINKQQAPAEALWVWVFDLFGTPSVEDMCSAAKNYRNELASDITIEHLAIGRGRRRKPRLLAAYVAQVDGNLLTRRNILRAVAILTGRAEPEESTILKPTDDIQPPCPTREEALQQNRLILVAEDNEVNQEVILQQLKLLGFAADIATNGREALSSWLAHPYALVLSDIHMPHMDGYQLASAIREEEAKTGIRRIPIIALTAIVLKGEAEHCKTMGMDDYLAKPTPLSELKAILEKWLPETVIEVSKQNPALNQANDESACLGELDNRLFKSPDWDADALSRMVGEDWAMHRRFLEKFLKTAHEQIDKIHSAAALGNIDALGCTAHAFKSAARTVGALRLGDLCQALELSAKSNNSEACQVLLDNLDKTFESVCKIIKNRLALLEEWKV